MIWCNKYFDKSKRHNWRKNNKRIHRRTRIKNNQKTYVLKSPMPLIVKLMCKNEILNFNKHCYLIKLKYITKHKHTSLCPIQFEIKTRWKNLINMWTPITPREVRPGVPGGVNYITRCCFLSICRTKIDTNTFK